MLLCGLHCVQILAQQAEHIHSKPAKTYIGSYFSDAAYLVGAPLKWKGKDWLKVAAYSAVGVGLYTIDDNVNSWVLRSTTPLTHDVSRVAEKYGNAGVTTAALGATYLTGLLVKNEKAKYTALVALKTTLISGAIAQVAKNIFHRARPYQQPDKAAWYGPKLGGRYKAFPSGHTTTAFALATTLSAVFKEEKWVGIAAYSFAALAGASRIHDNKHWASDVFAGALLGHFVARGILRNEKANSKSWVFFPALGKEGASLAVVIPLHTCR